MAKSFDRHGRQILQEPIPGGGTRFYDSNRTICIGLPSGTITDAITAFDANPPQPVPKQPSAETESILATIEAMSPEQLARLRSLLS